MLRRRRNENENNPPPPAPLHLARPGEAPANTKWSEARAFSGRGELRHANLVLTFVNLLLLAALVASNLLWYRMSTKLSDTQYLVFHDQGGVTTAHQASEFRSGASDEELRGRAWDVTRWYLEAGSLNYQTAFAEARAMMDDQMRLEFDQATAPRIPELKELGIYRKLEEARVRPLEEKDLPAGPHAAITRYDLLVEATLDTYRLETNAATRQTTGRDARISTGPVAVWVRLRPMEKRTIQNPTGLVVSGLSMIEMKAPVPVAADAGTTPAPTATPAEAGGK